jgi:hypothetical protein
MPVSSPREKSAHCQVSKCLIGGSHIDKGRDRVWKYSAGRIYALKVSPIKLKGAQ